MTTHDKTFEIETLVTKEFAPKGKVGKNRSLTVTKQDELSPSVRNIIAAADRRMSNTQSDHDNDVYYIHEYVEDTSDGTSEGTSGVSDYEQGGRADDIGIVNRVRNFLSM